MTPYRVTHHLRISTAASDTAAAAPSCSVCSWVCGVHNLSLVSVPKKYLAVEEASEGLGTIW